MDNLIPQGSPFWITIASSGVVFSGVLYKIYRVIKGDLREDKTVQNVDRFVEVLTAKVKELEDLNKSIIERRDALEKERATAIAMTGSLQGELTGWKLRVEDLKESRDSKDKEIQNLRDDITKLKTQNEALLKFNAFSKPESLTTPVLPSNGDKT